MVSVFTDVGHTWTGDLDELIQGTSDLPEWQMAFLRALANMPAGTEAIVGEEHLFRVVVV